MAITDTIRKHVDECLAALFSIGPGTVEYQVNRTRPEFEGDYTVVLFGIVKALGKPPAEVAASIGDRLVERHPATYASHALVKGFLNLVISDSQWLSLLSRGYDDACFGKGEMRGRKVMVEYSSPNTNKPLHLGHLRNNFLGWSIAEILKADGYDVVKSCIVNDRGVHICKSMIAWQRFAEGATPESTGTKGDHFVGDYYVKFNDALKAEVDGLVDGGMVRERAEKEAPIMQAAQRMLVDWEKGDPGVRNLWKTMNGWVYDGFEQTYKRIGSDFDKVYYESDTYLLGKKTVEDGLAKGVFTKREDGSVWIDLTPEGLDEKLLLRRDGTSVYITQDIGLAQVKVEEYGIDKSIYVIGDEQNYHMKVLKRICQRLGLPHAEGIHHLSYGMVELPTGKMKSREGTVVDADDIVTEMVEVAESHTRALGKVGDMNAEELSDLCETIGLGALKFFLLRVDPKKRMVFNPEESIDFHGFTGPFIQYTHARIRSILRKESPDKSFDPMKESLLPLERELLISLEHYGQVIRQAAQDLDPSLVAVYAYNLSKTFNSFYAEHSVTGAETGSKRQLRLRICMMTANVISSSMQLLGIRVPERM